MIFKELETKQLFDNSYGKSVWIDRYVHYPGTEQISIYIKKGYGANEEIINEIISEHELEKWVLNFRSKIIEKLEEQTSNFELIEIETKKIEIKGFHPNKSINMEDEKVNSEKTNNFDSMRQILFDSMKMVKDGKLDKENAKAISIIGQTIINSVKVELDFLKLSGSDNKPTMIE